MHVRAARGRLPQRPNRGLPAQHRYPGTTARCFASFRARHGSPTRPTTSRSPATSPGGSRTGSPSPADASTNRRAAVPKPQTQARPCQQVPDPARLLHAIAGAHQKGGTGSYALLPRGDDPFIGFHPHGFRHTALQLAVRAAANLQRQRNFFPHVHPQEFGKAIVGHELITDIGGIYRDLNRQLLCGAVVDEMWRLLYDDGVLRRGPDPDRVRRAREHCDALRITMDGVRLKVIDLEAKAEEAARRGGGGRDIAAQAGTPSGTDTGWRRTHAKTNSNASSSHSTAQSENSPRLTHARSDPRAHHRAEHARRLTEALGEAGWRLTAAPALADELPVKDVADLFGTTPQAIGRWRRVGQPKHRPLRWHGGEEAWHDYTQKDRRLRVSAINRTALTPDQERLPPEILIRLALEEGRANGMAGTECRLDAWETSGSSPPDDQTSMRKYRNEPDATIVRRSNNIYAHHGQLRRRRVPSQWMATR